MAINLYDVNDRERRELAHAEYVSAPDYLQIVAEANQRGYRHATIAEIHASAQRASFAPDLFCWRGGLWIAKP